MDPEMTPNITDHENVPPQLAAARVGIQQLTMGEIGQAEEMAGCAFTSLSDDTKPQARLLAALACMLKRRTHPSFTFNQAEALTLEEFTKVMEPADLDPKALSV